MLTLDVAPAAGPPPQGSGREVHVWRDATRVRARSFVGESAHWIECDGLGVFAFTPTSSTVRAWPDPGVDRDTLHVQFNRVIHPLVLQALGCQTLHAGAVSAAGGVLACCGVGGSGKSTLAYALGQNGWSQIADDTLVVRVSSAHVIVHPLPFERRFREPTSQYFGPALTAPANGAPRPGDLKLRATVLLQQDPRQFQPSVERVPETSAFSELLTHACTFNSTDTAELRRLTEDYLAMARLVPVFRVRFRPDFRKLGALLETIGGIARSVGIRPASAALTPLG